MAIQRIHGVRNNFTVADKAARQADVENIQRWVEVASQLGAPVLRVFADTQMRAMHWTDVSPGKTHEEVAKAIARQPDREDAPRSRRKARRGDRSAEAMAISCARRRTSSTTLISLVNSKWCGSIVDTGYYKTPDPYVDMEKAAPFAVNWQIKQSAFGAASDVPLDMSPATQDHSQVRLSAATFRWKTRSPPPVRTTTHSKSCRSTWT